MSVGLYIMLFSFFCYFAPYRHDLKKQSFFSCVQFSKVKLFFQDLCQVLFNKQEIYAKITITHKKQNL